MNDELLFDRLASHDGPAALDRAFEDRLYSILEREMRRGRSLQPGLLLAAALVLVLTITAAIAVGSGLIKPPWLTRLVVPDPSPSIEQSTPAPSTPAPSTPAPVALTDGPLQAGTYVARPFPAPNDSLSLTFNVPDGWAGHLPGAVVPLAGTAGPAGAGVEFLQITHLYDGPCVALADYVGIGLGVDDLTTTLDAYYGTEYEATAPVDVTLSGYSGKRMDLVVPTDVDFSSCQNGGYPFKDGAPLAQGPGIRWHLWILQVAWERVVILAHDFAATSAQDQADLLAIVNSVRIEPPSTQGWPTAWPDNPPGEYSWSSSTDPNVGRQGWMHNGIVSITFAHSGDADEDGPTAVTIAGYPGTYQEQISPDGALTRQWIVEVEGTRVTITMTAEPNATVAQLAEVDAIIESIRYEPTTDNFNLFFTLPAHWDSG